MCFLTQHIFALYCPISFYFLIGDISNLIHTLIMYLPALKFKTETCNDSCVLIQYSTYSLLSEFSTIFLLGPELYIHKSGMQVLNST